MDKIKIRIILIAITALIFVYSSFAIYKNNSRANLLTTAATWDVSLNITSQSEVDMLYNIVIDDLPSGVSVKLDNGSFIPESSGEVIFNNAGSILYSDVNKTKTHTLTFKAASGTSYVANEEININVITRQVT